VQGAGQDAFLELATTMATRIQPWSHLQRRLSNHLNVSESAIPSRIIWRTTWTPLGINPENAYDYAHEMSYSQQDVRNRFVGSGTWELPIGQGGRDEQRQHGSSTPGSLADQCNRKSPNRHTVHGHCSDLSSTGRLPSYPKLRGNPYVGTSTSPKQYAGSNAPDLSECECFAVPAAGDFATAARVHSMGRD